MATSKYSGRFVENVYGSAMEITIPEDGSGSLSGFYAPPMSKSPARSSSSSSSSSFRSSKSRAFLRGHATVLEDGSTSFGGVWEHEDGPFAGQSGTFQLHGAGRPSLAGWWTHPEKPGTSHICSTEALSWRPTSVCPHIHTTLRRDLFACLN